MGEEFISPQALCPQREEQASLVYEKGWCLLSGCSLFVLGVLTPGALVPPRASEEVGSQGPGKGRFAARLLGCNKIWEQGCLWGSKGRARLALTAKPVSCTHKAVPLPREGCTGNYQVPHLDCRGPGPLPLLSIVITVRYRSVYFSLNCHCHFINKATRAPGGWEACPALHTGWRQSPAALWVACCPLDQCCSLFGLQLPLSFKKLLRTSRTLMKVMSLDIFQIKS